MTTTLTAADWPTFRGGPERTDISSETGLLKQWPEGGPPLGDTMASTVFSASILSVTSCDVRRPPVERKSSTEGNR